MILQRYDTSKAYRFQRRRLNLRRRQRLDQDDIGIELEPFSLTDAASHAIGQADVEFLSNNGALPTFEAAALQGAEEFADSMISSNGPHELGDDYTMSGALGEPLSSPNGVEQ